MITVITNKEKRIYSPLHNNCDNLKQQILGNDYTDNSEKSIKINKMKTSMNELSLANQKLIDEINQLKIYKDEELYKKISRFEGQIILLTRKNNELVQKLNENIEENLNIDFEKEKNLFGNSPTRYASINNQYQLPYKSILKKNNINNNQSPINLRSLNEDAHNFKVCLHFLGCILSFLYFLPFDIQQIIFLFYHISLALDFLKYNYNHI